MRKVLCLLLAFAMLLTVCTGCGKKDDGKEPAQEEKKHEQTEYELTDAKVSKDETVYINLSPDGEVKKVSVTDKLHTDMPQVRVEDKSDLKNISDVKTFVEPVVNKDSLYWDMDSTDLYYNGSTDKNPPLNIKVQYFLDGEEIAYNKLAGKSGDVKIKLSVSNELTKSVKVDGKSYEIQCPMLFVGGMLLPEEGFDEVQTDNGVILGDGSHKLVFFMGVPGMNKSLGLSDLGLSFLGSTLGGNTYTMTAKAEDFSLGNMMFVAVPFSSVRALGFKDISLGVDGVKNMLSDIENLMNAFASLNIDEMIQVLYGDADKLEDIINAVGDASKLYEDNKALLDVLNKYITDGNLDKLEKVLNDLEKIDTERLSSVANYEPFAQLVKLIGKLDKNLADISQFTEDYLEIVPVFNNLNKDLKSAEVQNALNNLPETIDKLHSLVDVLKESQELIEKTSKLFNADSLAQIKSFADAVSSSESLDALSSAQAEHLAGRVQAWLNFGESYDIFTQRTSAQSSSVVFVYKTEAVS